MPYKASPLLYVFLLAPVFYLIALIGFPLLYNVAMSLQDVTLRNLGQLMRPFVGLDNFREVVGDPTFRKVFANSLVFVGVNVVGQVSLGLLAALFFAETFAGAHFLRGLMLATWMLPGLVVGALWKWMYASQYGVVNYVLQALHVTGSPIHWLSDPAVAMTAVIMAHIWFIMPFTMILIAAALTAIPQDLYEAASVDGATRVRQLWHIAVPALRPVIYFVLTISLITSMQLFIQPFIMTQGGPLNATISMVQLLYRHAFVELQFGYGSAIATFLLVLLVFLALINKRVHDLVVK